MTRLSKLGDRDNRGRVLVEIRHALPLCVECNDPADGEWGRRRNATLLCRACHGKPQYARLRSFCFVDEIRTEVWQRRQSDSEFAVSEETV